jgi:hypothetical protein
VTSWLDVVHAFARARSVPAPILDALAAFAGPEPRGGPPPPGEMPWHGSFEALERTCLSIDPRAIAADLEHEVDAGQAALFQRRFLAVDAAIAELADDAARVLRVGLRHRLAGILLAPRPRALRVRALADFYFSLASRHRVARVSTEGQTARALAAALSWDEVAPGVRYARLEGVTQDGPVHANLLRLAPGHVRLDVVDCREHAARGTDFAALVRDAGAIAAISGGFFLYTEPDIVAPSRRHDPVGLLMNEGVVHNLPTMRRGALAVGDDGRWSIGAIGMLDVEIEDRAGRRRPAWVVNRAHGRCGPESDGAAIVGLHVVAIGPSVPVPLNGCVIPRGGLEVGDRVRVIAVHGRAGPVHTAIAGGPLLLEEGRRVLDLRAEDFWGSAPPVTFSQDETGDRNLLPRLAAGLTDDGELVLAAIDGRNFERALGMTLGEVADLLTALGCRTATNLDGGSSKRMVVGGTTRDLPTTEITDGSSPETVPVRPVYTAVLVRGPQPKRTL